MRIVIASVVLLLTGCEASPPPPPPPHQVKLQQMCQAGDAGACGTLAQIDQANAQNQLMAAQIMSQNMARTCTPYGCY